MPLLHAKVFSPSASKTWMNCPGAPKAQESYPNLTSEPAEEGTAAHELGERTLADPELNCADFLGQLIYTTPLDVILDDDAPDDLPGREWYVTDEMVRGVQEYVDYCRSFMNGEAEMFVEVASDFGDWVDKEALEYGGKAWGTSDCNVVVPRKLDVFDLKYGEMIQVDAVDNSQALIYALGVYALHDWLYSFDEVTVHIIQPRNGGISTWTITVDELLAFGEKVRASTAAIAQPDAPRIPGDAQCQWCRARKECGARAQWMLDFLQEGFEDDPVQLEDEGIVSNELLGRIIIRTPGVTKWLKEAKEVALQRVKLGAKFPNIKPVKGKGSYSYVDETKAEGSLTRMCGIEVAKPRVLVSTSQAKKLIAKDGRVVGDNERWVKNHVKRNEGNMTLAPLSDRREEIVIEPLSTGFETENNDDW